MEIKNIITTSWDDGHPLDDKLAELLDKYNLKATFYVPHANQEQEVMSDEVLRGIAEKFEIGGHTVNHIYLNSLNYEEAKNEIFECRQMLESKVAKTITAFCYPGGKYSERDIKLVEEAGFLFGRTTKLLRTTQYPETKLMNTTVQAFNHSSAVLSVHCLKNGNINPLLQNLFFFKGNKNFIRLAETILNNQMNSGGVFHLWGHSWEIEQYNLWSELEELFKILAFRTDFAYLNNTESWKVGKIVL